jgi:glycosyltransferase involved in cell wall biosynthesis
VASLRESKGHQHVIAALASIASRQPGLRLYLVGEGEYRGKIEKQLQELALQDRVFLTGSRDNTEMPLWFNAADVSILASSREGWPNVILESLACGTPVIGTPAGQIPEIIGSGDLGIVAERNADALADAIQSALSRNWDREALSRYAHGRPWSTVAEEVRDYFTGIVGDSSAKAKSNLN